VVRYWNASRRHEMAGKKQETEHFSFIQTYKSETMLKKKEEEEEGGGRR
jgi:hypothetical protein